VALALALVLALALAAGCQRTAERFSAVIEIVPEVSQVEFSAANEFSARMLEKDGMLPPQHDRFELSVISHLSPTEAVDFYVDGQANLKGWQFERREDQTAGLVNITFLHYAKMEQRLTIHIQESFVGCHVTYLLYRP
jgi:hypothetical protein